MAERASHQVRLLTRGAIRSAPGAPIRTVVQKVPYPEHWGYGDTVCDSDFVDETLEHRPMKGSWPAASPTAVTRVYGTHSPARRALRVDRTPMATSTRAAASLTNPTRSPSLEPVEESVRKPLIFPSLTSHPRWHVQTVLHDQSRHRCHVHVEVVTSPQIGKPFKVGRAIWGD